MIIDWRSRENSNKYKNLKPQTDSCPFCAIDTKVNTIIEETATMRVITNAFPYEIWDNCVVLDHLMITPRRHTDSLGGFDFDESMDYIELLEKYDRLGYSVYGRTSSNKKKSVVHQHTHLFKMDTETPLSDRLNEHLRYK